MPGSEFSLRKLSVDSPTLRSALDVGESHFASVEKFFELYGLQTLGDGDFQQVVERLAENNGVIHNPQPQNPEPEQTEEKADDPYQSLIPVDDCWYSGGVRDADPNASWTEEGLIQTFKQLYKNDEKALRALLLVCSTYKIEKTDDYYWNEWSVDHENRIIYIAKTSYLSERSNLNAAKELYQILSDEFLLFPN